MDTSPWRWNGAPSETRTSPAGGGESSTYDDLPYGSQSIPETLPSRLAAIARLFGTEPPPPATARVLELGCAEGGNLLPMAVAAPGATFVGIDLSAKQIATGERVRASLGLGNVSLRVGDVAALGPGIGTFDYVLAHGLFSWIPAEAAESVLALIDHVLSPTGVAYVSYNTYPGWHLKGLVRDILLRGTRGIPFPAGRLAAARDLLGFVTANSGDRTATYGGALRDVLEQFSRFKDTYLFHEWLEPHNRAFWFLEFVEKAARHGLAPLADAHLGSMPMGRVKPDIDDLLSARASGRLEKEELLDVLRNRAFRQTLLVRAGGPGREEPDPAALDDLRFTTSLVPTTETGSGTTFRSPAATVTTDNPHLVASLRALHAAAPRTLGLSELAAGTPEELRPALLRCVALGLVEARLDEVPCCVSPGEAPVASPFARFEVEEGALVTSLAHRVVELDPASRLLLRELDGRPRDAVVRSLARRLVAEGLLRTAEGRAPSDGDADAAVAEGFDDALASLARLALLVG